MSEKQSQRKLNKSRCEDEKDLVLGPAQNSNGVQRLDGAYLGAESYLTE